MTADHSGPPPEVDADGVPWPTEPPPDDLDNTAPPRGAGGERVASLAGELPSNVHQLRPRSGGRRQDGAESTERDSSPLARRLVVRDVAEVVAEVDAAGPPTWLIEGLWPSDAYGAIAAESKAGKTWAILDLAVAAATGRPWLGRFACPAGGRVVVFLGEGGERATVRRLRAVCEHHGLSIDQLAGRLRLCFRVPRLLSGDDLAQVQAEITDRPAVLAVVDPLYLAAAGAQGSSLFDMGAVLEPIQAVCQHAGAALAVVHHWNKTGSGGGAQRMSGAGTVEWGRVLGSVSVRRRTTEEPSKASNVVLGCEFIGGEIPDQSFVLRRRVWADDPNDLASPLHYVAQVLADDDPDATAPPERPGGRRAQATSAARRAVLDVLRQDGPYQTPAQLRARLQDRARAAGEDPDRVQGVRAIQRLLERMEEDGQIRSEDHGNGRERYWSAVPVKPADDPNLND